MAREQLELVELGEEAFAGRTLLHCCLLLLFGVDSGGGGCRLFGLLQQLHSTAVYGGTGNGDGTAASGAVRGRRGRRRQSSQLDIVLLLYFVDDFLYKQVVITITITKSMKIISRIVHNN